MPKEEGPLEYKPRVRDTKRLAKRIDLDYVKRAASTVSRRKRWIWGTMVFLLVLISIPLGFGIGPGKRILESGPVSSAHALYETKCESCHMKAFQSVSNEACKQCHDGAAHPAKTVDDSATVLHSAPAPRCAECHIEHRGKPQLADVANGFCTECHANLKLHATELKVKAHEIKSFPGSHPDFSTVGQIDMRPVKLNHAAHMPVEPKTVRGIQLPMTCSGCHVLDLNSLTNAPLPMTFDQDCRRCHEVELDFDTFAVLGPNARPAPHGVDKATIDKFVRKAFQDKLDAEPEIVRRPLGKRNLVPEANANAWFDRVVRESESMLYDKCRYCHMKEPFETEEPMENRVHRIVGRYSVDKIDGEPWLPRGEFSHKSHRAEECSSCHSTALTSMKTEDVLIPGMKSCVPCHAQTAGHLDGCSTCHQYHNRSLEQERRRPLQKLMSALTLTPIEK